MKIISLDTIDDMLSHFDMIQYLYPKMTYDRYKNFLEEMTTRNYKQLAVYDGEVCVGLTGFWFGIKLWTGKYLELDNFIVHPDYRKKGIAKLMTDYIEQKAIALNCTCIVLDAFTGNFTAHRFYYNQGYEPRGFHFIKMINEAGLS